MIDVTPTGKFIAMWAKLNYLSLAPPTHVSTERNATLPLLQLPAEVRNSIWKYVLGGQIIKPYIPRRVEPDSPRRYVLDTDEEATLSRGLEKPDTHRFSLLRVSRQIYTETAVFPYTLSVFSFYHAEGANR